MHEMMVDLAGAGDFAGALACPDELLTVSVERSMLAAVEHREARREATR